MQTLAIGMIGVCILSAVLMMGGCRILRRRERDMVQHMRASEMYKSLYRGISRLGDYAIDQLVVEATGVTVTSVYPAHTLLCYGFKQNGNACRNPDIARYVALALGQDFPLLSDGAQYRLSRYRIFRLNGRKEYGYRYTIRRACKDQVLAYQAQRRLRTY